MKTKLLKRIRGEARSLYYAVKTPSGDFAVCKKSEVWGEPYYEWYYNIIKSHPTRELALEHRDKLRRNYIMKYLDERNAKIIN